MGQLGKHTNEYINSVNQKVEHFWEILFRNRRDKPEKNPCSIDNAPELNSEQSTCSQVAYIFKSTALISILHCR